MEYVIGGAVLTAVSIIFYTFMAVAVHDFTIKKWRWNKGGPECFFAGLTWPIFILFLLVIGYPFIFISRFSRMILKRGSRKTYVSEVK